MHTCFSNDCTITVSSETTSTSARVVVEDSTGDDPDIQILESTSTSKTALLEARFARKRALNPHITYKDHSKNPLFKSTLQDHMRSLAASGLALNQHQAIALRLRVGSLFLSYKCWDSGLFRSSQWSLGICSLGWSRLRVSECGIVKTVVETSVVATPTPESESELMGWSRLRGPGRLRIIEKRNFGAKKCIFLEK